MGAAGGAAASGDGRQDGGRAGLHFKLGLGAGLLRMWFQSQEEAGRLHGGKACGRGAAAKWEEVSGGAGAGPRLLWELNSE